MQARRRWPTLTYAVFRIGNVEHTRRWIQREYGSSDPELERLRSELKELVLSLVEHAVCDVDQDEMTDIMGLDEFEAISGFPATPLARAAKALWVLMGEPTATVESSARWALVERCFEARFVSPNLMEGLGSGECERCLAPSVLPDPMCFVCRNNFGARADWEAGDEEDGAEEPPTQTV